MAERNRIPETRVCPYVWSPHNLEHRCIYKYTPGSASNVGIYETNVGVYKLSYIPLLILNKIIREHSHLVQWWEAMGLAPIGTKEFQKFLLGLEDAIRLPFNISKAKANIPNDFNRHKIGTIVTHQMKVGINNLYLEALYMNMSLVPTLLL